MSNVELHRDFLWPVDDTECRAVVFDTLGDLDRAVRSCLIRRVAIQAGGNCGVWPIHLAQFFDEVHTFEPDWLNYGCLEANVRKHNKRQNIILHKGGLSSRAAVATMDRIPGNCGAHQVSLREFSKGPHVALAEDEATLFVIDDMPLAALDLIYLDIEGHELHALIGAKETIRRFRPVICFEDKGLSERYGVKQGDTEKWLSDECHYTVQARFNRDVLCVPQL